MNGLWRVRSWLRRPSRHNSAKPQRTQARNELSVASPGSVVQPASGDTPIDDPYVAEEEIGQPDATVGQEEPGAGALGEHNDASGDVLSDAAILLANDAAIAALLAEGSRPIGGRGLSRPSPRVNTRTSADESTVNDAAIAAALAEAWRHSRSLPLRQRDGGGPTSNSGVPPANTQTDADYAYALSISRDELAGVRRRGSPSEPSSPETSWLGFTGDRRHRGAGESWLGNWFASSQPTNPVDPDKACVACLDCEANACLIPCGHVAVCLRCSGRLDPRRCPVCRLPVEQVVPAGRRAPDTQSSEAPDRQLSSG